MNQKQCPCPEAKADECCKHCPTLMIDSDCQPVSPRNSALFKSEESPLYAIEAGDEVRPILNGGW